VAANDLTNGHPFILNMRIAQTSLTTITFEATPRQKLCEARRIHVDSHPLVAFRTARERIVFVKHLPFPYFEVGGAPIHSEQHVCISDNGDNDGD
jgi:hypothetical protein